VVQSSFAALSRFCIRKRDVLITRVIIYAYNRHSHRMIFGLIAVPLATIAGLDRHDPWNPPLEIAMLSVAMGYDEPRLV
jgi:hypothetical protein